ncbi:hypothetical protein [Flavobacterium petrolei]|uniref:hypothetical protein n=1 Tax=Flavobacterium petrolei TaxID=2259594 RepID=UPI0037582EA7
MGQLKIKLASGKNVTLEAFHMSVTYSGLLAGEPTQEMNEKIINNFSSPKNWGARKSYIEKSNIYALENVLKPIIYSAWLSAKPINDKEKQFDGSEIVVVWFGNEKLNKSIKRIIVDGLEKFDWNKHAKNFNI